MKISKNIVIFIAIGILAIVIVPTIFMSLNSSQNSVILDQKNIVISFPTEYAVDANDLEYVEKTSANSVRLEIVSSKISILEGIKIDAKNVIGLEGRTLAFSVTASSSELKNKVLESNAYLYTEFPWEKSAEYSNTVENFEYKFNEKTITKSVIINVPSISVGEWIEIKFDSI